MIVVSNSSPLVSLGAIGRFEPLRRPVRCDRHSAGRPSRGRGARLRSAGLRRSPIVYLDHVPRNCQSECRDGPSRQTRQGEAEAIALALELPADLLLMDERLGRIEAARFGLQFIGTLGVLIAAKSRGHLREVKPVLDELMSNAGFRVSEALRVRFLKESGE